MSSILPDSPRFQTAVYGTIFAERALAVQRLREGEPLILVPDPVIAADPRAGAPESGSAPLAAEQPKVWVHAPGGDVVGHLSPDINRWLVPRMLDGARYAATVVSIGDPALESWKRLVIDVRKL